MVTPLTNAPTGTVNTVRFPAPTDMHFVYCTWGLACGRKLMQVAGSGDVVIFKTCERCGSLNIIDMRSTSAVV